MKRAGLLLLIAANVLGAPQKAPKQVVFLTNYVFLGRHAPFFVGLEKGFYRDAGFDIRILPSTGSGFVISALEGGQADYGIAEAAPVVQAVAKGAKVQAFGVFMDESTSGLASLEPYPTPQSVAEQPVAAAVTDSARVILPIIFGLEGLDPATLDWVAADPSVYFPLLLQGRARLITASIDSDVPTLRHRARGKTIHFSSFADWGYDVFGYFLVARADHIEAAPDEVRAFASATAKSVRYAIDHPEEAARILVAHNPTRAHARTLAAIHRRHRDRLCRRARLWSRDARSAATQHRSREESFRARRGVDARRYLRRRLHAPLGLTLPRRPPPEEKLFEKHHDTRPRGREDRDRQ